MGEGDMTSEAESTSETEVDSRDRGATFLELFFDLVFVFAITQIAAFIHHEDDLVAYLEAALIFVIVWWAWSQFTWAGNAIDIEDRWSRLGILAATGTAFFMAQGVPDAFGDDAPWFTFSYLATILIGLSLYWYGLRSDRTHQRALLTYLPWVIAASVVVAVSGFIDEDWRAWGYALAFVLFAISGLAGERGDIFRITPGHFTERHGLIVIIALGESIIAVGVASSGLERTAEPVAAMAVGVVGAIALWWAYFDWFSASLHAGLARVNMVDRVKLARDAFSFGHYPLVFGIVCFAVAVEEAVAHPDEPMGSVGRFAVAAGIALFLGATVAIHYRDGGVLLVERLVAVIAVVGFVALAPDVNALTALSVTVGILIAALVVERVRHHAGALRIRA
jgi:low temperature requirement protein LtrA